MLSEMVYRNLLRKSLRNLPSKSLRNLLRKSSRNLLKKSSKNLLKKSLRNLRWIKSIPFFIKSIWKKVVPKNIPRQILFFPKRFRKKTICLIILLGKFFFSKSIWKKNNLPGNVFWDYFFPN